MTPCRSIHSAQLLATLLACAAGPAHAQGPYTWIAFDSSPSGTPPTVVLMPSSNLQQTVLDVTLHGFYFETITEQNQMFRRLSLEPFFHDEALYRQPGRPELPAIVHEVGALVGVQPQPEPPLVAVLDEVTIPDAVIYPFQTPGKDHPGDPPPPFQWDQSFYQQTSSPFPAVLGQARGTLGRWSGLDVVGAETYPFRAVPALQQLRVARHYQVTIPHSGTQSAQTVTITRRQGAQYQRFLQNWTVVLPFRPMDFTTYRGDYLIVTAPTFVEEVQPLVDQKRSRGYRVTVATTDETGAICFFIRNYITKWWAVDPTRDHYVLLVGDADEIPLCSDENGNDSDDLYGCVDGTSADGFPDPLPEARVGRLPCSDETEVAHAVEKTLRYERGFDMTDTWLSNVLLTAHQEIYPGFYKLCQQLVADHNYVDPPTFIEEYGGDGTTNMEVYNAILAGVGIVCYRGHGTSEGWSNWNTIGEEFTSTNFTSHLIKTPVVFAIACQNNAVSALSDCIGEKLVKSGRQAVAHYGAPTDSWTEANHLLDLELFRAIYDDGIVLLADAIAAAEAAMAAEFPNCGEANLWMYLTLGDPELKIWREPPPPIAAHNVPAQVPTGPGTLTVRVKNNVASLIAAHTAAAAVPAFVAAAAVDTSPVPLAIVSVHKAGEVAASYYTDTNGEVQIPIDPATPGPLALTVYTELDERGGVTDTITVYDPAGAPGDAGAVAIEGLHLSAPMPSPFRDQTSFSYRLPSAGRVRLVIYDVRGTHVRTLVEDFEDAGEHTVRWNGRNASGVPVGAGLYFIRLDSAAGQRSARVVRLW